MLKGVETNIFGRSSRKNITNIDKLLTSYSKEHRDLGGKLQGKRRSGRSRNKWKNILKEVMARHHMPRDRNMNLETAFRFP